MLIHRGFQFRVEVIGNVIRIWKHCDDHHCADASRGVDPLERYQTISESGFVLRLVLRKVQRQLTQWELAWPLHIILPAFLLPGMSSRFNMPPKAKLAGIPTGYSGA